MSWTYGERWASRTTMIRGRPADFASSPSTTLARFVGSATALIRWTASALTQGPSPHGTFPTAMLDGGTNSMRTGLIIGRGVPSTRKARRAAGGRWSWRLARRSRPRPQFGDPRCRLFQPRAGQPPGGDGGHERVADRAIGRPVLIPPETEQVSA